MRPSASIPMMASDTWATRLARYRAAASAALRSEMSRAITWKAGSPPQVVRTLVTSMTLTVPSGETIRTSPCSKNWPGSVSWDSRSATTPRSSGWRKSVIGLP